MREIVLNNNNIENIFKYKKMFLSMSVYQSDYY